MKFHNTACVCVCKVSCVVCYLLSVSLEKKYPQVGFIVVWNGDMEFDG